VWRKVVEAQLAQASGLAIVPYRFAVQKVEGSSLFIRLREGRGTRSVVPRPLA
jgi:hypothetical protein